MKTLSTLLFCLMAVCVFGQSKPDTTTYIKDVSAEFGNSVYATRKMPVWDTVGAYFGIESSNGKIKGEVNIIWYNGYVVREREQRRFYLNKNKVKLTNKIIYLSTQP